MNEEEHKKLCDECKTKSWKTKCHAYFKMSGESILPTTTKYDIPNYCKYKEKVKDNVS